MNIFVTGTRGIPDIPGGVEKHCQELYPLIAGLGVTVTLATRTPYILEKGDRLSSWKNIHLTHVYAPHRKSLEAIVHTFLAVIHARLHKTELIHIHAVGPALMIPLARLLGLTVVWTNHGPDYDRGKWGIAAKRMLSLGEWLGGHFAHEVIAISHGIKDIIARRCKRDAHLIFNGVTPPEKSQATSFLETSGIVPGGYLLAVARFVPEKGLHDLLEAFKVCPNAMQLVIAGDADHETEYSRNLKKLAASDSRVVLTGYITGEALNQVYSHARLFVLPSYHEGLPIALLEAMSYDLPVLVSDISANREVALRSDRYFPCGDCVALSQKIEQLYGLDLSTLEHERYHTQLRKMYNWESIAEQTMSVYHQALLKHGKAISE